MTKPRAVEPGLTQDASFSTPLEAIAHRSPRVAELAGEARRVIGRTIVGVFCSDDELELELDDDHVVRFMVVGERVCMEVRSGRSRLIAPSRVEFEWHPAPDVPHEPSVAWWERAEIARDLVRRRIGLVTVHDASIYVGVGPGPALLCTPCRDRDTGVHFVCWEWGN